MADSSMIFVRTRTGKKIHLSHTGSSVCRCGHWLKVNATRMKLDASRVKPENLCENCLPPEVAPETVLMVIENIKNGRDAFEKAAT